MTNSIAQQSFPPTARYPCEMKKVHGFEITDDLRVKHQLGVTPSRAASSRTSRNISSGISNSFPGSAISLESVINRPRYRRSRRTFSTAGTSESSKGASVLSRIASTSAPLDYLCAYDILTFRPLSLLEGFLHPWRKRLVCKRGFLERY